MREIKFRGWITELNDWADGVQIYGDGSFEFDKETEAGWVLGYGGILMQFTGLLDKNKAPIYEGDILKIYMEHVLQANPYIVEDIFDLHVQMNRDEMYYRITDFELIGNIYQNPELIKEQP